MDPPAFVAALYVIGGVLAAGIVIGAMCGCGFGMSASWAQRIASLRTEPTADELRWRLEGK